MNRRGTCGGTKGLSTAFGELTSFHVILSKSHIRRTFLSPFQTYSDPRSDRRSPARFPLRFVS